MRRSIFHKASNIYYWEKFESCSFLFINTKFWNENCYQEWKTSQLKKKHYIALFCFEQIPYFIAPDPRSLPSIPENVSMGETETRQVPKGTSEIYVLHLNAVCVNQRNLTELIVAVDVGNLLQLYASMLFERRILIFASKLSTVCYLLSAFIQHPQT